MAATAGRIHEDEHMTITQAIFAAFTKCRTKSHLSSYSAVAAEDSVGQARQHWDQLYQRNGLSRLRARVLDGQLYVGTPAVQTIQQQQYRVILDCTFQPTGLRANVHGLELVRLPKTKGRSAYVPIRLVSTERISMADKLLLAFDAFTFSQACGIPLPRFGKLIHGREYATATVPLASLYTKVQSILTAIAAQHTNPAQPPLVLNKHCIECQYATRCREIATKADDLSLLAKMSEQDRKRYHEKGIFTVTQLSYTFRPRRRPVERSKHEYALQALAIRKNQIHVVGAVTMKETGTPGYLDVEGEPDRDFYYCIGLRFEAGGAMVQRSYWADGPADEGTMWVDCLCALGTIEAPRLVHYGSYETTFLRQMKKRYPNPERAAALDQLIASAVNLLSTIYARVYFPTYSNGLKDVARYLGFRWSEPTASGLVALAWRREWEHSQRPDLKRMLTTYNAEDCAAAQTVAEALSALSQFAAVGSADVVDVATLKREYPQRVGNIEFALPEFRRINESARWDHQRDKVYARSNKRLSRVRRNTPTSVGTVPINKVVQCEELRPKNCTECGATTIYRWGRLSRTVYDFKLSGAGIKRWVVLYSFPRYICWQCKTTFHQYAHQSKYGNTMCSYAVTRLSTCR
jgi:predicted RecB family nuclease